MAGPVSNYSDEILAAMDSLKRYGVPVPGGTPAEELTPKNQDEDPLVRALMAATAQLSGQENEQLPADAPRITDPLDRARYPGS